MVELGCSQVHHREQTRFGGELQCLYDLCFPSKIALSFTSTDLTALECFHSQLFLLLLTPLLVPRNSIHTSLQSNTRHLQYLRCRCPISMVMTVGVQWPGCEAEPHGIIKGEFEGLSVYTPYQEPCKESKDSDGKSFTSQVRGKPSFCRGINKRKQNPTQLQPPEGDSRPGNQWLTLSVCKLFWLQTDSALISQDNPLKGRCYLSHVCTMDGLFLLISTAH